ncbi:1102_t:CDS:2, partial [Gigaspora margarita]
DQIEGLQITKTIDAVYDCTADALILLVTPQAKYLKHTTKNQPNPSLLATSINQNKKQKRGDSSLPLSDSSMILLLYIATTNIGIKSDDNQIESVLLAALVPMIVNDRTTSSPNSSQYATDAQKSEKMETESNKTIEADSINTVPLCTLYSQAYTNHPRPGRRPGPRIQNEWYTGTLKVK